MNRKRAQQWLWSDGTRKYHPALEAAMLFAKQGIQESPGVPRKLKREASISLKATKAGYRLRRRGRYELVYDDKVIYRGTLDKIEKFLDDPYAEEKESLRLLRRIMGKIKGEKEIEETKLRREAEAAIRVWTEDDPPSPLSGLIRLYRVLQDRCAENYEELLDHEPPKWEDNDGLDNDRDEWRGNLYAFGKDVTVTIQDVLLEKVGREKQQKPVVHFLDTLKPLILNKTNYRSIARLYGENSDNWIGKSITLFKTMAEMAGEPVEAIRVRLNKKPIEVDLDDQIGF